MQRFSNPPAVYNVVVRKSKDWEGVFPIDLYLCLKALLYVEIFRCEFECIFLSTIESDISEDIWPKLQKMSIWFVCYSMKIEIAGKFMDFIRA